MANPGGDNWPVIGCSPDIESQHEDHDDAEHGPPVQPGHHHPVTAIKAPARSSENNLHT